MAQEVGVRSIADLKQFSRDLRSLSEQLTNAFTMAERKMHVVCDGWNDKNNQQFMAEFSTSSKEISKIATRMQAYAEYIRKSSDILEMYQQTKMGQ